MPILHPSRMPLVPDELLGSRAPGFGGVARRTRKAAVVVGDEALQHTPEAFDATFGLRRLRGDEGDAELREGAAAAAEQALQQVEIACGGFCGEELGRENFSGSIVLHAQSGEARAATFEPVVRAAIELQEFAFARGAQTALAMSGSAAFAGRAKAFLAQHTPSLL